MITIEYKKSYHKQIIAALSHAILDRKVVAIPTDTSYGLAALAASNDALDRLYEIKGRSFSKPIHIVPSSNYDITDVAAFNSKAKKLARIYWPGALTLVLPMLARKDSNIKRHRAWRALNRLAANSGYLGFRKPDHLIPLDIAKKVVGSITATSANVSGQPDCYSGDEVIAQFSKRKLKPDILLYVKSLPKRKPSTVLKFERDGTYEILRQGPISKKQITQALE